MPPTAQVVIQRTIDTLYAPFRYSGSGIPEGTQVSDPGWIYRDTSNDMLWYKQTGTSNTGWKAIGGVMVVDTTATGNAGTGVDTLQTWTLPANTLANDGDAIRITMAGTYAGNAEDKVLTLNFGGTEVFSVGGNQNGYHWSVVTTIIRTSATTQKALTSYMQATTTQVIGSNSMAHYASLAITLSSAAIVLLTGESEAGTNNNVVKQIFQVELLPAP